MVICFKIRFILKKLYPSRIEGAWYVCFDTGVEPEYDNCNVLSFGVNKDPSFDIEMNTVYKCQVESFDPFIIDNTFRKRGFTDKLTVTMNDKWRFHKMGIVGNDTSETKKKHKIGWMATLEEVLAYTNLNEKVIDVFKIDTEGSEIGVLESLNVDYACKYFKQFLIETHPYYSSNVRENAYINLRLLRKLEACFLLFHRNSKFIKGSGLGAEGLNEFQSRNFKIYLSYYRNELDLMGYLMSIGELFFINKNFLKEDSNI